MSTKLPKKLGKEPLVDVAFELRVESQLPMTTVLPGYLLSKIQGIERRVERLPLADLPQAIRDSDQGLKYAPMLRFRWGTYLIQIGDKVVNLASNLPYQGWQSFRPRILELLQVLDSLNAVEHVTRYALKYVDLIEEPTIAEQISALNLSMTVGGHKLDEQVFSLRTELRHDSFLHILQISSNATFIGPDGSSRRGIAVDVDSLASTAPLSLAEFLAQGPALLDSIHLANKRVFFDCLTSSTISRLEPTYDD